MTQNGGRAFFVSLTTVGVLFSLLALSFSLPSCSLTLSEQSSGPLMTGSPPWRVVHLVSECVFPPSLLDKWYFYLCTLLRPLKLLSLWESRPEDPHQFYQDMILLVLEHSGMCWNQVKNMLCGSTPLACLRTKCPSIAFKARKMPTEVCPWLGRTKLLALSISCSSTRWCPKVSVLP